MNKFDCDRFVRGAEEVDRKRIVIKRVLRSIEARVGKKMPANYLGCCRSKTMCEHQFAGFCISFAQGNSCYTFKISSQDKTDTSWWNSGGYADNMPANVVVLLHAELSVIAEKIDLALPKAGLAEHFQFFSDQARD